MPQAYVETFLMAEDLRGEKSGQYSLIGVFSDPIFANVWPVKLPKICFQIRVRHLDGRPHHRLVIAKHGSKTEMAKLEGATKEAKGEINIFNYFVLGLAFPEPGRYVARFSLQHNDTLILEAEYAFGLRNPNVDALYVECDKCKIKYPSGIVAKEPPALVNTQSVCPNCGTSNLLDAKTIFHIPNPE